MPQCSTQSTQLAVVALITATTLSASDVPGIVLRTLCDPLLLTGKYCHYPHVVDGDVEVQRRGVTEAELHARRMAELGFDPGLLAAQILVG